LFACLLVFAQSTSVVLVGHSMGGIIARGLFHLPNFRARSVSTIFTLGSPHRGPVIAADALLSRFYARTNRLWRCQRASDERMPSDASCSVVLPLV
jgi:pimeloyl-ACP methyl ester carboxylesterase